MNRVSFRNSPAGQKLTQRVWTFTGDDDVLDVFTGVVRNVDVHFDDLAVIIELETRQTCLQTGARTICLSRSHFSLHKN